MDKEEVHPGELEKKVYIWPMISSIIKNFKAAKKLFLVGKVGQIN